MKDCGRIIGVYENHLKNITIKVTSASLLKFPDCDLVVYLEKLINYGTFDMSNIDAIFNLGYTNTKRALINNKNLLINN
ncbi:hypothetical protein [Polaribacter sp. SA4-12]|uniref:hypothetical protein n=1 Tax=Polaribacter sp. SA4-12 TaxID=1312072 RepID=UPI000B558929|nr:hypothetical protein [Polaribacter sp. SA4-12]ARV15064.1 hypothetical protein BTO07_07825 [Polaribacter sp. SA4-12]